MLSSALPWHQSLLRLQLLCSHFLSPRRQVPLHSRYQQQQDDQHPQQQQEIPAANMASNVTVAKPPHPFKIKGKSVFLAGSIEMGAAPDWQSELTQLLSSRLPSTPITVLNPRREQWDYTWKQTIHNPQFKEQVEWELDAQDACDVIAMYFSPETKAPISLLELGLYAKSGKMVVCCPDGYWRKGNVEVVCDRYGITLTNSISELEEEVVKKLSS